MSDIKLIAEIGWSHCGDMLVAKDMIDAAKESGADYAKFQSWQVSKLKPGPWDADGRREIYEKAELKEEQHGKLKSYCDSVGISFLTSCFRKEDLGFIRQFCNEVKIPSPECIDHDFVQEAVDMFDQVYVSTGACEISEYYNLPWKAILLHCVSSYPCVPENFHWEKMIKIKSLRSGKFGFSGHSQTIWDAIVAISEGAIVIEKHFTVDRNLPGRDNKFALLPSEFKQIREFVDNFKTMKTIHSVTEILECEHDYRKHHLGRWG